MMKALRKAISTRSRLKNIYNKNLITIGIHIKTKNFYVKLLKKTKMITSILLILKVSVITKTSGK